MVLVTYNIGHVKVELFYILLTLPLPALRPLERDVFFDYVHVRAALVCYVLLSSNWKQKMTGHKRIGGIYLQLTCPHMDYH